MARNSLLDSPGFGRPQWWWQLSWFQKSWPALLAAATLGFFGSLGGLTQDHGLLLAVVLVLGYSGARTRALLHFLMPLILTAIVYDTLRYIPDWVRAEIHVSEPYLFDKYFFGIRTENGVLTPNEWWQLNTYPVLDLISGAFYILFIPIFVVFAGYVHFWKSRTGTRKFPDNQLEGLTPQMMWAFFWVNVLGYTTYYWYPAAPPWYVALHGLGPADLSVPANAAGCVRFDALLGTSIFNEWYGRSADVFGAIPSLHVAYPLIAVYYAHRFGVGRVVAWLYFLGVSFAAVYLNHHYILDVLWGVAYGLLTSLVLDFYYTLRHRRVWVPSYVG